MTASARKGSALTGPAKAFLGGVALVAIAAALPALLALGVDGGDVVAFGLLAGAAAAAQMLVVETWKNLGFPIAIAFVVAGVLMLPVGLVALLGLAMHAPDIARRRYPWYIQTFNTSNYTLNALAAWVAARAITDLDAPSGARWTVAGLAACVVFVALNHVLLSAMLRLARGHSARDSRLFSAEAVSIDLALAGAGVAIAALGSTEVVLALAAAAPLLLAHRLFLLMAAHTAAAQPR
jgi:hypothetical protein